MALANIIMPWYCSRRMSYSLLCIVQATLKQKKCLANTCWEGTLISATSDNVDNFTVELVRRKADKWKHQNVQKSIQCKNERNANDSYEDNLQDPVNNIHGDVKLIDDLITEAIRHKEYKRIIPILNYSRRNKHCPHPELLLETASMFSRQGDKAGVQVVKSLCECLNRNEYYNQAEYKHYLAEATWISGNIGEALDMFAYVYTHHATLRRKVRNMTKFLFGECISNRSEASLVLITNFAKKFAKEYGDYYFLSFLWQFCFLSEWFCDQRVANELLEQYQELRTVIMDRIKVVAVTALRQEEIEVVQRLLEVTLRYEMRHNFTYILREFFDLKCKLYNWCIYVCIYIYIYI